MVQANTTTASLLMLWTALLRVCVCSWVPVSLEFLSRAVWIELSDLKSVLIYPECLLCSFLVNWRTSQLWPCDDLRYPCWRNQSRSLFFFFFPFFVLYSLEMIQIPAFCQQEKAAVYHQHSTYWYMLLKRKPQVQGTRRAHRTISASFSQPPSPPT